MPRKYDAIIIGGGITGAGIARDCAMRGLKIVLLEKRDFCSGTTGACMGMLHGGARYLFSDPNVTRESCEEAGIGTQIVPFLLFRIPFLMIVPKGFGQFISVVDDYLAKYDKYQKLKKGHPHLMLKREEALKIEPNLNPDIEAAGTTDEWGIDTFRLTILNLISACEKGAIIRNHCEVKEILRKDNRIYGVKFFDRIGRQTEQLEAKFVINAGGPWVPQVAKMAGTSFSLRPSKGIHLILDRRITSTGVIAPTPDQRQVELVPHENSTLLGMTDTDFEGDLENLSIEEDEIDYLLTPMEALVPKIRQARIIRAMAGIRPLILQEEKAITEVSRDFKVIDHLKRDGLDGFLTVAGGKMSIYRLMAEKLTDLLCKKLNIKAKCRTAQTVLPGAEKDVEIRELSKKYNLAQYGVQRLKYRHGSRIDEILKLMEKFPSWKSTICHCEPVTEAEIRYVIQNEWARTLDDIRRRTRMGMGPCQGFSCLIRSAMILAEELDLTASEIKEQIENFLQERWKGKFPALRGRQIIQEELNQLVYARKI